MRLCFWLFSLLFVTLLLAQSFAVKIEDRKANSDGISYEEDDDDDYGDDDDDYHYPIPNHIQFIKPAVVKKIEDPNADYDDEYPIHKNFKFDKKPEADDYDEGDDLEEIICTRNTPCQCDITHPATITCDHVIFGTGRYAEDLQTTNVNPGTTNKIYQVVKLTHNRIKELRKAKIVPKIAEKVEKLDLSNNIIEFIEAKAFDDLIKLKVLKLSYNYLTFDSLEKLNKLSLRENPFSFIPAVINQIPHLSILDLSGTNINEFDTKSLSNDHLVETLIMRDLEYLYAIDDCAFCGLQNLKVIDFTNCTHLYSIHTNAFGSQSRTEQIPKLEEVSFEKCDLTSLNEDLLDWEDLKILKIGGNPLVCNKNLMWLAEEQYDRIIVGDRPECIADEMIKIKDEKPRSHVKISSRAFILPLGIGLFIIAFVIGVVLYTRRRVRQATVFRRPELLIEQNYILPSDSKVVNDGYTYDLEQ
uniref:Uncharacterized protein n=1 Tax=Acrobeloides nanus TaxID=290746 RepID=A0A914C3C7_9BILA